MQSDWLSRVRRKVAWSCAALLMATGAARAEGPEADLKALVERQGKIIEEQGKQLEALKKKLEQLASPVTTEGAVPAGPQGAASAPSADRDAVRKVVADYITEQEKKKKEADEQKKLQQEAEGTVVGSDLGLTARWLHGLWVENADKSFRVHVGGRTQLDTVWMTAPDNVQFGRFGTGRVDDAVGLRRARLAVEGTFWEVFDFNCEYDFLNTFNAERTGDALVANTPVPTDLWIQVTHLPYLGNFRIGVQKPPISFEHLTSSRFLNFIERSFMFDAFVGGLDNGFRPGLQFFNWSENERFTWALGLFKNNNTVFGWNVGDGEMQGVGRVTFLPWYEHDGRCLLHLGLAAMHQDLDDDAARYRARTMLRNGPAVLHTPLADLRVLDGKSQDMIVPELVMNVGPFTLQAELYASWTHGVRRASAFGTTFNDRATLFHKGYYVELLYFLTGEHRRYDTRYPRFDRVIPHENFWWVKAGDKRSIGRGAWQVGARYSYLDLDDKGVNAGVLHDVTVGLNWFFNPNAKLQWNYTIAHRNVPGDTADGVVQGFGMRLAFDF